MSYNPTFLDAFFSSDTFYLAGFIVLWIICRNSYRKDFPPNDGKAEHSKNEEVRAKTPNIGCDQFAILLSRVNEIDEDTLESHHRQPGA